jgi:hypothetical protein
MNTSIAITAVVSALVTWLFMYLDARLFDTPKTKLTYFKGMSFVAALSATIVYFMGNTQHVGGAVRSAINNSTAVVQGPGFNEDIFTGLPPF